MVDFLKGILGIVVVLAMIMVMFVIKEILFTIAIPIILVLILLSVIGWLHEQITFEERIRKYQEEKNND